MSLTEFFGYLASVLVFMSFYMRTMVALRCVAVASNLAFITYALLAGLLPILILHVLLLPTNLYRLHQIRRLLKDIAAFKELGFPLEPLIPFMRERPLQRGEVLFRKGEVSSEMFYLAKGRVRIRELGALLQPGEIFGEISLFAPDNRRTGTAVAEDGGIVFVLSEKAVLQIFHQNPQLGYALTRIITGRLIENYRRLEPAGAEETPAASAVEAPPAVLPDAARAREAEAVLQGARRRQRLAYATLVLIPLVLLLGTLYSQRSYLGSVLFRDAVVTSWLYVATAPISGQVEAPVPEPGDVAAGDAPILRIRDLQADDTAVARLEAEVARMEERVAQLEARHAELRQTSARWEERSGIYARVFRDSIDAGLGGLEQELESVRLQLEISGRLAQRVQTLASQGNASRSTADERLAEIMELRGRQSDLEKQIALARTRAAAAEQGVFVTADGNNPDWAFDSSDVLELSLIEAADALAEAKGALARLEAEREAARRLYGRTSLAGVSVPAGSLVWGVSAGPGSTVGRGAPLLEWIDCSGPLVDVPVSDVGLVLVRQGAEVTVRVDGVAGPLAGTVVYARGSAARLGRGELAAVAAGEGEAQVIVALEDAGFGPDNCPVGRAAYVDLPATDPLRRLLASLRL